MNIDDQADPRDSRTKADESPEDFLFAVPDEGTKEAVRNPYEDTSGFEDEFSDHGLGPCAFDGDLGAGPSPSDASGGLANLFLDDDELAPGDFEEAPHGGMSGKITHSYEMPAPPPAAAASKPDTARPKAPAAPAVDSQMIPGRGKRVSYSQQQAPKKPVTAVTGQKAYRPVGERPPTFASSSSLIWVVPFAAFLSGACFAAYYFLKIGSPVFAGVTATLGVIAALFCRVFFKR